MTIASLIEGLASGAQRSSTTKPGGGGKTGAAPSGGLEIDGGRVSDVSASSPRLLLSLWMILEIAVALSLQKLLLYFFRTCG